MADNKILKIVYTFFLGLLLAIFVGVGINTFYPGPKMPEYPAAIAPVEGDASTSDAQMIKQQEYDKSYSHYQDLAKPYNRNVSIITLAAAVIFLVVSILFEKRISLLADGIMLGGLFTLLYSLFRGFASEDSKYLFVAVSVSIAIVVYLGYHKFVKATADAKPKPATSSRKSK